MYLVLTAYRFEIQPSNLLSNLTYLMPFNVICFVFVPIEFLLKSILLEKCSNYIV